MTCGAAAPREPAAVGRRAVAAAAAITPAALLPAPRRRWHSAYADPRETIAAASLGFVGSHGWTTEALAAGAMKAGFPAVTQGVFPNGGGDLVHYVLRRANVEVSEAMQAADLASLPVNERIAVGVDARLRYLRQFRGSWAQAMAVGALPANALTTGKLLGVMADEIWWQAGDRSLDMTWYSRRVLLAGVVAASELHMITDADPALSDTRAFVRARIRDVAEWGRLAGTALTTGSAVGGGLLSIAEAAVAVLQPFVAGAARAADGAAAAASPTLAAQLPRFRDAALRATDAALPPMAGALVRAAVESLGTMMAVQGRRAESGRASRRASGGSGGDSGGASPSAAGVSGAAADEAGAAQPTASTATGAPLR